VALPIFDQWAPAQYVARPDLGNTQAPAPGGTVNSKAQNVDQKLSQKLGATVVLALLLTFVLQRLGFRYVIAGSATAGVGR
jgi:hypothetical protein